MLHFKTIRYFVAIVKGIVTATLSVTELANCTASGVSEGTIEIVAVEGVYVETS